MGQKRQKAEGTSYAKQSEKRLASRLLAVSGVGAKPAGCEVGLCRPIHVSMKVVKAATSRLAWAVDLQN